MARFIGRQPTVFERSQNNGGFLTGPNHVFSALRGNAPPGKDPDADVDNDSNPTGDPDKDGAGAAPNLREMQTPTQSCDQCAHFSDDETDQCTLYNFQTKRSLVCDSFSPVDGGVDKGGDANINAASPNIEAFT